MSGAAPDTLQVVGRDLPATAAAYRIRLYPDPILSTPCDEVESINALPAGLFEAMHRICGEWRFKLPPGLGISANQVGSLARVCIARLKENTRHAEMINPVIVERSPVKRYRADACLSAPGFQTSKLRHDSITVVYRDIQWVEQVRELTGMAAVIVQHECDHLDGRTIMDGLSRQQRRNAERCIAEAVARG